MGGKRGNENAQMSKEDYDAMQAREEARRFNEGNEVVTQGFQRASAETLRARRRVKAKRPPERPESERNAGANPFAGLGSFAATSTSVVAPKFFNFGNAATTSVEAATTVASTTSLFSFGAKSSDPDNGTNNNKSSTMTKTTDAQQKSVACDLENALSDPVQNNDPTISNTSNIQLDDSVIQSEAQQGHNGVQANPNVLAGDTTTTTTTDKPTKIQGKEGLTTMTTTTSASNAKEEDHATDPQRAATDGTNTPSITENDDSKLDDDDGASPKKTDSENQNDSVETNKASTDGTKDDTKDGE